jgi:hypothetical protein
VNPDSVTLWAACRGHAATAHIRLLSKQITS